MSTHARVEGRRDNVFDCTVRVSVSADKFRRGDITADAFLDQATVEFYHLATTASPTFKEIESGLDLRNGSREGGAVLAAMIVCIWHPYAAQATPKLDAVSRPEQIIATSISLPEQSHARPLFAACKDATLERLQAMDDEVARASGARLLDKPGIPQLLVVLALLVGNKHLPTCIIENYPPGPDHDMLFSRRHWDEYWDESTNYQIARHPIYAGVAAVDTGCDIWVSMVRRGWATPRLSMLSLALASPDIPSGRALIREVLPLVLARPDFSEVDTSETLWRGLLNGAHPELVDAYLELYNPKQRGLPDQTRYVSRAATYHRGAANLEVLVRRDAADFFGMDPAQHVQKRRRPAVDDPPDSDYYGRTLMATALHHAARRCNAEAADFLLALPGGDEPRRDGYGRTAYDSLKHLVDVKRAERERGLNTRQPEEPERIYKIFEGRGWRLSSLEEMEGAATPRRLVDYWGSMTMHGV